MSGESCPMPPKTYEIVLKNKKFIDDKELTPGKVGWGLWAGYGETEITKEHRAYIQVLKDQILSRNPSVVENNQIAIEMKQQIKIDLGLSRRIINVELANKSHGGHQIFY